MGQAGPTNPTGPAGSGRVRAEKIREWAGLGLGLPFV